MRHSVLLTVFLVPVMALADLATGSGCAISSDYVLTACHVVNEAQRIEVEFDGQSNVVAEVVAKDVAKDWAVLKLSTAAPDVVCVDTTPLVIGSKIYTLGFPSMSVLGKNVKFSEGTVSSLTGIQDDPDTFQFSVPIQPGNSGGALFNDQGALIGIVLSSLKVDTFYSTSGGALPQNVNFGIAVSRISGIEKYVSRDCTKRRSVNDNLRAVCLVKAHLRERCSPSVGNESVPVRRPKQNNDDEVSERYTQIKRYLMSFQLPEIRLPDGTLADVTSKEGFDLVEAAIRTCLVKMKVEVSRRYTSKYDLSSWMNDAHDAYATAHNVIAKGCNDKGWRKDCKLRDLTFWSFKLGQECEVYQPKLDIWSYDYYTVRSQGEEWERFKYYGYISKWSTDSGITRVSICSKKPFFKGNLLYLLLGASGRAYGVGFRVRTGRDETPVVLEQVAATFETKYGFRFYEDYIGYKKRVVTQYYGVVGECSKTYDKINQIACKYFEDEDVRIVITDRYQTNLMDGVDVIVYFKDIDALITSDREMSALPKKGTAPAQENLDAL